MISLDDYGIHVSRETMERFQSYHDLLLQWTKAINLIAPSTINDVRSRHIADSAQVFALMPRTAKSLTDLGSGGGLPGIVLAILAAEKQPELRVTLVESDQRKAIFLKDVVRRLDLSANVLAKRIEDLDIQRSDVLTARALAPMAKLLTFADRLMKPSGMALLQKGRNFAAELAESQAHWRFTCHTHQSLTEPQARILQIEDIHRVDV